MLNSGTFKHNKILITNSKVTLSMALKTKTVEAGDALAAPHITRQIMAATPKTQTNMNSAYLHLDSRYALIVAFSQLATVSF